METIVMALAMATLAMGLLWAIDAVRNARARRVKKA